jgi:DNA-binding NarL/FixJ family response regulator
MSPSARPSLRVLIVSSQPITRAGMAAVLRAFRSRVKVVGEVGDVEIAPAEAARSQAEVVLFDTRLDTPGGLDEVGHLATVLDDSRVVVLARRDEARFTWPTLQRGAAGFLLDTIAGSDLVEALGEVSEGAFAVDPALAGGPRLDPDETLTPRWPGAHLGLTQEESQILELLARGQPAAAVGRQLGLTGTEVKAHIRSACRRLHARDRSDALARLAREGLFSPRNN